jgi:hypothetical protein
MSALDWLLTVPICSACGAEDIHVPERVDADFVVVCRTCQAQLGWWSDVRARLDREASEAANLMVRQKLKQLLQP